LTGGAQRLGLPSEQKQSEEWERAVYLSSDFDFNEKALEKALGVLLALLQVSTEKRK